MMDVTASRAPPAICYRLAYATACAAIFLLAGPDAVAQAVNGVGITPFEQVATAPPPATTQAIDATPVVRLFGNWDGLQPRLAQLGINLQLEAITEFAGNTSGGTRQGATFANQIGFETDVNWERLAGLIGLSTHVVMVSRSGSSDSTLFGDNLLPVQEIYGSGGDVAVHLVSAYAQETLFNRMLDVAVGRMNVENDFASSPLYCSFMNNALCGDPKALPGGDIGHSAYPDAAWGGRVRVRPVADIYVETGIYEVNQGTYSDANFRSGFKFDASQDSGVYLPVELGWEPKFGTDKLPGHYKIGFGYDTSGGYKDFGNALAAASVQGFSDETRTGNTQLWLLADQMLLRQGTGDRAGLIALAGFIHNDPNNSVYAEQYFGGLIDQGFWPDRPTDTVGVLATYNSVSGRLGNVQSIEQALNLPLGNKATGVQSHEIILEVNYGIQVYRGVKLQPEFQYVFKPNAQSNIPDATVFGFNVHVEF
jgi:porin